jgi:hypothetical protein
MPHSTVIRQSWVPWRRRVALTAITAVSALAAIVTLLTPTAAQAVTVPPASTSYYVSSNDTTWAYNQGHALGQADLAAAGTQTHVAVLDFGAMYLSGSTWYVTAFSGPDMTLAQARVVAEQFGRGYWAGAGSDLTSTLYVGLGTNNSAGTITAAAGAALAAAAATGWADTQAAGWTQAYVIGANDFEAWGKAATNSTASASWIDGYNGYSGHKWFVNFGSADGCPSSSIPSAGSCNAGLNAETIWRVSWSGTAYPLPEIYNTSGTQANQWKYLSLYSVNAHGSKFTFKGAMTQLGACGSGCPGTNNSPTTGWTQLYNAINSDSRTTGTPGGPTDIRW